MDHIRELQVRLLWIVVAFVLVGAFSYPFFGVIVSVLVAPLGGGEQLVYLTPGGAFSFVIKVCMYVGLVGALPVAVYQLYKFIAPTVKQVSSGRVLGYAFASLVLALAGIVFAYVIILPAALYFLTNFNLDKISAMLTIDSYFSFVIAYLLAGAVLFQLPLVMLLFNSIKPLTPRNFMKYQRHVIVAAFIFAAVVSPTPDAVNQTLLALPLVVMYQFGGLLVWLSNMRSRSSGVKIADDVLIKQEELLGIIQQLEDESVSAKNVRPLARLEPQSPVRPVSLVGKSSKEQSTVRPSVAPAQMMPNRSIGGRVDSFSLRPRNVTVLRPVARHPVNRPKQLVRPMARTRTIDGFLTAR